MKKDDFLEALDLAFDECKFGDDHPQMCIMSTACLREIYELEFGPMSDEEWENLLEGIPGYPGGE